MTATARFSRVAVAVALGVAAPLIMRPHAVQAAPVELAAPGARLAVSESAPPGPTRGPRRSLSDTALKRERGKSERPPSALRRRIPRARSGAATSPQPVTGGSQYVPDQPWETEFFVDNSFTTRRFAVRLASTTNY